jgi:hypothetical protein
VGIIESALDALPAEHRQLWVAAKPIARVLIARRVAAGAAARSLLLVLAAPLSDLGDAILEEASLSDDGSVLVAVVVGQARQALLALLGIYRVEEIPLDHFLVLTDHGGHPGLSVARVLDVRSLS